MPHCTPAQKKARLIQAVTGKPYTACLALAEALTAKEELTCSGSTAPPTSTTGAA